MTWGMALSTSTAAAESAGPSESATAALIGQQRIPARAGALCRPLVADQHTRHQLLTRLQFGADELGIGAVGNAKAQVHALELLLILEVDPGAAARFRQHERREQRVDRLCRLAVAGLELRRC